MKKKTLIIPVVAAMLAVSCGDSPAPAKDWSKEIKDFMTAELGEVLPYLDLDEESLVYAFASDEFGGQFYAYDDNETNLVEAYGEKLVSQSGFTFDEETEAYYKQASVSTVQVILEYYPATDDYAAGNEIDINYMYKDQPTATWSEDVQAKMQAMFGTGIVFPYAFIDTTETFHYGKSTEMNFYMFGAVDSDKCVTYLTRLSAFGFEIYVDEDNSYYALGQIGDNVIRCDVYYIDEEEAASYGYDSPLNEIDFTITSAKLDHFPAVETLAAIDYHVEEEVPVPDLESSVEELYYVYEEDYGSIGGYKYLYCDSYAYGLTAADLDKYAQQLIGEGWILSYYDGVDYTLYYPNSSMFVDLLDYTDVVDPDDPYTAAISFYSYFADLGDFSNAEFTQTLLFLTGIPEEAVIEPTEEGDDTYKIELSTSELTVESAITFFSKAIQYPGYHFYYADKTVIVYEDPEAEEKVIKSYEAWFVADGWTEDNNAQYVCFKVSKDEAVEGQVNISIEIGGVPVEHIWTAQEALEFLIDNTDIGRLLDREDLVDYTEQAKYPYLALGGTVGWPESYYQTFVRYYFIPGLDSLRGFSRQGDEFLTREITLADGSTTTLYYITYEWTSRDGSEHVTVEFSFFFTSGYFVPEVDAYSIPANPEEPAEPEEPEEPEAE